ncbi:hypothetical protein Pla175_31330 [Pirellulimonas nuda]|uniref:Ice-binding protein C-terminal domain-containing protein n=1 Tax=Pirellulimonas nuda TaxID=2528009 RepID=A0A518DE28_9BACT|nr:PEP-CTERM sorting domain-containing protein [Pirellulimonas nuda]QDU89738.1 hypothetical protein Pla175_31330 [Pirellulimonas nuda]
MSLRSARLLIIWVTLSTATAAVYADPVVAGTTSLPMFPIQDVILPANSAFNPNDFAVLADDVTAMGPSIFTRLAQVGSTIQMVDGYFSGTGVHPMLGHFQLLTGAPNGFSPMTLTLENVVQDPSHPGFASGDPASIVSADATFVVPNYGVNLLDLGVSLEVRDSFFFKASFDGLPPSVGTVYTADPYEGQDSLLPAYLAGTNTVVAYSTQRRLVAVPEPASLVLASLAAAFVIRRRV